MRAVCSVLHHVPAKSLGVFSCKFRFLILIFLLECRILDLDLSVIVTLFHGLLHGSNLGSSSLGRVDEAQEGNFLKTPF